MNEDIIKEILDKAIYTPSEDSWNKLHQVLQKEKVFVSPKKSRFLFLNPLQQKIAASIAGIGFIVGGFFLLNQKETVLLSTQSNPTQNEQNNNQNNNNPTYNVQHPDEKINPNSTGGIQKSLDSRITNSNKLSQSSLYISETENNISTKEVAYLALSGHQSLAGLSITPLNTVLAPINTSRQTNIENNKKSKNRKIIFPAFQLMPDFYAQNNNSDDWNNNHLTSKFPVQYEAGIKLGIPNSGRYQININTNYIKELNSIFFFASEINGRINDVQYQSNIFYKYNEKGSLSKVERPQQSADMSSRIKVDGNTTTTYSNTIISLGITPKLGVKISNRISIAAGGDLYYNFNNKLHLKNNPIITVTGLKSEVNSDKKINNIDAGLVGQLSVNLSDYLSAVAQYRHGLTTLFKNDYNQEINNSSVSLGLQFKMIP